MSINKIFTHNLGFPRIGARRELKQALESYWSCKIDLNALELVGTQLRKQHWEQQLQAGQLDLIPVGDFAWYDQVLEWTTTIGCIPKRHQSDSAQDQPFHLDTLFRMARGRAPTGQPAAACEMTKWFDTNYHFITPEIKLNQEFALSRTFLFEQVKEAEQVLGIDRVKPVIIGPLTWLYLAKGEEFVGSLDSKKLTLLEKLLPVYNQVLQQFSQLGVKWTQIDEPVLCLDLNDEWRQAFQTFYQQLNQSKKLNILIATYFGNLLDNLKTLVNLPVEAIHIDAVRAPQQLAPVLESLKNSSKILSVGLIDGRNIWRSDLDACIETIQKVIIGEFKFDASRLWLSPSCSLLHVPFDLKYETKIDAELKSWLSFAVQKLEELSLLGYAALLKDGCEGSIPSNISSLLATQRSAIESRRNSVRIHNPQVKSRMNESISTDRSHPFDDRKKAQQSKFHLPKLFPTTTIGSFPQTQEIRSIRLKYKNGTVSRELYEKFMKEEIEKVVRLQEEIGLDVLVHGEPERNDMVEYFGELMNGYAFTENGWTQSFGSRCVKPPVIFGDISLDKPMTVEWSSYAQSLTDKPMKGMLTGPVTILNWSFVRDDQPRSETCKQLALVLRDEVLNLEKAGIKIIQIDEPAVREGLPLRKSDWNTYLKWAVDCFKLTTSGVEIDTQIHTHMCYSEFNDIIDSIGAMDADVISIETSRSNMELLQAFEDFKYPNDIGPGVYDIHSPNVPNVEWMVKLIKNAIERIPKENIWINPDCGLKTRGYQEVKQALIAMVQAAQQLRTEFETCQ
ncbi:predicted protein [Naegleria gruberi]|uniref:5-methyltetrahydropteroyltriglutamate--homocysteine S-methyltransferase n=1 Tax=Naegleria gruberi TaxID=5762 RepID=D2VZ38_NAEGR|nr:uncharacterized protein NAEGRDRAFT_59646 [Naegleria gruberi]EFC37875.1 predicted protein [Naegleria gruberi]|eukprot:XP_002670619.1 predicted protein [Naegleria gruberi strain NEG-M]